MLSCQYCDNDDTDITIPTYMKQKISSLYALHTFYNKHSS